MNFFCFPRLDVSIAEVILSVTSVNANRGGCLDLIGQKLLCFPRLAVSIAKVILSLTKVDVSTSVGIRMFIGGKSRCDSSGFCTCPAL